MLASATINVQPIKGRKGSSIDVDAMTQWSQLSYLKQLSFSWSSRGGVKDWKQLIMNCNSVSSQLSQFTTQSVIFIAFNYGSLVCDPHYSHFCVDGGIIRQRALDVH